MKRVLVTYVSHSGSTKDIAEFIAKKISVSNYQVEVKPVSSTLDISSFDEIVAGGLIYRFGWHPEIVTFLKKHSRLLAERRTSIFVVGLRLVKTRALENTAYSILVDPNILHLPKNEEKLSWLDSYTTFNGYMKQALPILDEINPISLCFFCGNLDFKKLSFSERLIMRLLMLSTGIKEGDHRNWDFIQNWSHNFLISDS